MNSKKKFILFSKSYWNEPQRIRHQVANLLLNHGHQVVFFEKPDLLISSFLKKPCTTRTRKFDVRRTKQLIHHQLRLFSFLRWLNAKYEKISISKKIDFEHDLNSIIINFNYDYYFLRDIFPFNKIITIINDDFVAQSKINKGKHALHALEITCKNSDAVFVVSRILAQQIKNFCTPTIFLPWAQSKYTKPSNNSTRKSILIWAYIDSRIDFELIIEIAKKKPELTIDIYGQISPEVEKKTHILAKTFKQIKFYDPIEFIEINFKKYFCTVVPYKNGITSINAVTVPNKTFQLLSMGLPIVAHGIPNFIDNKATFKTNTKKNFIKRIDTCFSKFYNLQRAIKDLVNKNQPEDRYKKIMSVINN
jgi:hypothetical protein